MSPFSSRSFLSELKRRHVLRVLGVYLVAFWAVLQVTDVVSPALGLPAWSLQALIAIGIVGLPIFSVVAWIYDFSRHGLVRTPSAAAPLSVNDEAIRLVVLPFRPLHRDAESESLAFSLADAIACSLAGIRSLVVRSTMSVSKFAQDAPDLQAIARDANVDVVVTGIMEHTDASLELQVQLLRVPDGTVLWADKVQWPRSGLAACQTDVARRIVESLGLPLDARK